MGHMGHGSRKMTHFHLCARDFLTGILPRSLECSCLVLKIIIEHWTCGDYLLYCYTSDRRVCWLILWLVRSFVSYHLGRMGRRRDKLGASRRQRGGPAAW